MIKLKSKIIKGNSDPKTSPQLRELEEKLRKEFSSPNKPPIEQLENRRFQKIDEFRINILDNNHNLSSESGSKSNTLNTISEVTETDGSGSLSTKHTNSKPTILIEESNSCRHADEAHGNKSLPNDLKIGAFDSFPGA